MFQGFILQDSIVDGKRGMELHYWVKLADNSQVDKVGQIVKLIFTEEKPIFFVDSDSKLPPGLNASIKELPLKAFNGRSVKGVYFNSHRDYLKAKSDFQNQSIRTYESDIWPSERFLMERFINGSLAFQGQNIIKDANGYDCFINPQIKKSNQVPKFSILSLDIETSLTNDLYSIGIHHKGNEEIKHVYMLDEKREYREISNASDVSFYDSEYELLKKFLADFSKIDPDFIAGWHVVGFDLKFLERKCHQHGLKFSLGRDFSEAKLSQRKSGMWIADIAGRSVLDGPRILKLAFYQFENFKLGTVASEVLGGSKDIEATGSEKVEEITRRFHEDKLALAKYNLLDCTLVLDIYEKLHILDHLLKRVRYSGLLIDKLGISTRAFDHLYLPLIHRRGFVANNTLDIEKDASSLGGYVMEGKSGLHEHVIVLDFKSLYPTIIQTFKIDPLSRLKGDINPITTVNGVQFSKTEHILPEIITKLLADRKEAKDKSDANLSQAIKILMNSFYGVLGSGGCRFYHADLPQSITQTGQWLLKEAINIIEDSGHEVVYGDTDSLFIKLNFLEIGNKHKFANELATKVNERISEKIQKKFGIESFLEIEYEKYFAKLFLPMSRGSDQGTKKRYVGYLENQQLYFSGMEFVRSDWTKASKEFQFELYTHFFKNEDMMDFIKDFVARLKNGEFDEKLVYKKRLSKDVSEYTKTNPPHVKAARLLLEKEPKRFIKDVEYVMTRMGPVPLELGPKDIDYSHYIDKQLAPIGNDVLRFLGLSFEDIISGSQISLF